MNGQTYERFFLSPNDTWHRRYEVLRAVFVEQHPMKEVAERFEISHGTVRNWASEFRTQRDAGQLSPFLSSRLAGVPHWTPRKKNVKSKSRMSRRCPWRPVAV